jgi:hypothetical protein
VRWNKGDSRIYKFEITASEDGNEFKKVFEGKNRVGSSSLERYSLDETSARYLNLTVNSNSQKGWVSVKEVNVFGRPIS